MLALVCVLAFGATAGSMLVIDEPQPSDVIVVLAGETDRRPARAIELLDRGFARHIVMDVPADARIYNFTQLQLAEQYFQELPQHAAITICPIRGLSTKDESREAEQCLAHQDGDRILIVTSDFHTRRTLSIFRHEIPGRHFSIAASRDDQQFGSRWWTHRQWAKTCFEEWLRVLWWNVIDRWR